MKEIQDMRKLRVQEFKDGFDVSHYSVMQRLFLCWCPAYGDKYIDGEGITQSVHESYSTEEECLSVIEDMRNEHLSNLRIPV